MESKEIRSLPALGSTLDSGIDNFLIPLQEPNTPYLASRASLDQINSYLLNKFKTYPASNGYAPSNPTNGFSWTQIRQDGLTQEWIYNSSIGNWVSREEYIAQFSATNLSENINIPFLLHATSTEYDSKRIFLSECSFDIQTESTFSSSLGDWQLELVRNSQVITSVFSAATQINNRSRSGLKLRNISQLVSIPESSFLDLKFTKTNAPPNLSCVGNFSYRQIYSHS